MNLLNVVVKSIDDLKLNSIRIYNMKGLSPLFDYMIIATASNDRQADAAVKRIRDDAHLAGYEIKGIEGKDGSWFLVDCKDLIVNIFKEEEREHYGLEKLYIDVEQIDANSILNS